MKTEFVSTVSHELRTPLTSIKGFVDLLLEGEAGDLRDEVCEFLGIVKNNADRLVALVNDLLDVSRIESGKIQLQPAPLNLTSVVDVVTQSSRPQMDAKAQRLVVDVPDGLPPVLADRDRLIQIVTNLFSNAYKYTPSGGTITISACQEGAAIRLSVQDTGIGMTLEEQEKIFSRFFRARNRMTQEAGGTGLGLSITRSLVEMHGGTIEVISAPNEGSTFSVTLPLAVARAAATRPSGVVPAGGMILVVDDEPDIADLVRRYLERAGYTVLVAATGEEALELARAEHPDLITLDLVLPDVDGFTVLERLKGDEETCSIPVIMLSILDESEHGKLLGAVDYLTKPLQEHVLLQHIEHVLAGRQGWCSSRTMRRISAASSRVCYRTLGTR